MSNMVMEIIWRHEGPAADVATQLRRRLPEVHRQVEQITNRFEILSIFVMIMVTIMAIINIITILIIILKIIIIFKIIDDQ